MGIYKKSPQGLFGAAANHDKRIERTFMQKNNEPEKQKPTPGRRNRHSNSFRDQILRYLHYERGLSWSKAVLVFRTVFDHIAKVVRSGEPVEMPGLGILKSIVRKEPAQRRWKPLHNVRTGKTSYRVVPDFRLPRQIRFKAHPWLDFTPPPPPPTPQEIQARQLAAELLGCAVDDYDMDYLQQHGVDIHPHKPGALLRRLRGIKQRGWQFQSVERQAGAGAWFYWM
jgi:nucleoid DNA-binding protein